MGYIISYIRHRACRPGGFTMIDDIKHNDTTHEPQHDREDPAVLEERLREDVRRYERDLRELANA